MTQFASTQVRAHNGAPTIFVNDQPLHGMTATSVAFTDGDVVRGFVDGGVEVMMIWIEVALKCWKGPGQYDWSYAEERLRFFEEHAGDTKWIIRVRLGLVDPWFGEQFPDEVHSARKNLSVCVIHSSIWREHISQIVRDFTLWLQGTKWAPRIIGFMLNAGATEEWLPFDVEKMFQGQYHPVMAREFRVWLQKQYRDDATLQEAWHNSEATIEKAGPPGGMMRRGSHIWGPFTLRDPALERPAIDYYRFLNETLADSLIDFCRIAKEAATAPIICGGFHSYLWWETGVYSYIQEYGHGLVQRLNNSPHIDFMSDITSYDGRYPGGPSGYLGLPACQNLHNKLHYTEVDLTTCANMSTHAREAWQAGDKSAVQTGSAEPVLPDRLWKWDLGMCGRDDDEQIAILQREAAHNVITGSPYWWFDIRAHSFQPPPLTRAIKRMSDIGKQSLAWDRSSGNQVAFVCSEDTPLYQSAMNGSLLRFEMESVHGLLLDGCNKKWGLSGVPYDTFELHDLAHPDFPGDQYKLLIFVNCAFVSHAAQEGIRRWQNNNRTHLWTHAAACLDEQHFDAALGEDLIGIKLNCHMKRRNVHVQINDVEHALTRGGSDLDFGTEGAVGPVFYADDSQAQVLGTLRDGGEPAFALREHADWKSVYLSMLNFGPALFRNLARFAGAHVWCESDDVIYANRSMLCLHSATAGHKTIALPQPARVVDLLAENPAQDAASEPVSRIECEMEAYRTRLWHLQDAR